MKRETKIRENTDTQLRSAEVETDRNKKCDKMTINTNKLKENTQRAKSDEEAEAGTAGGQGEKLG